MVALALTRHLPRSRVFGGYVGLGSRWRLVEELRERDRPDRPWTHDGASPTRGPVRPYPAQPV